jgi:hypothetical protein
MNSTKQTARLAGLAYLLNGVGSALGTVCIPLVRPDVAAIAKIAATGLQFRIAFVSDLVAQASGIFLVLLLYELFKPVNRRPAAFMVALFLASVPISIAIALNDVAAHVLLRTDTFLSAFSRPQLDAIAMVFLKIHVDGAFAAQLFWGLWLMPFGLLVFKSGFLPRVLGVFLIIASFANVIHCFVSLLLPGPLPVPYQLATTLAMAAGELPMIFWLLVVGVKTAGSHSSSGEAHGRRAQGEH